MVTNPSDNGPHHQVLKPLQPLQEVNAPRSICRGNARGTMGGHIEDARECVDIGLVPAVIVSDSHREVGDDKEFGDDMERFSQKAAGKEVAVVQQHDERENKERCGAHKHPKVRQPDHAGSELCAAEK